MDTKTKQSWFKRINRRKAILVVLAGFVVILLASISIIAALSYMNGSADDGAKRDPNESKKIVKEAEIAKRNGQTRDTATKEVATGNTQKVDQIYQAAVQSEPDTAQKIKLYIDQSEVLFNAGKFDESIAAAQKGGQLSDDKYLIADWLSRLYQQNGNFKQAASYYTLAGQWASSTTNVSGFDKKYYDDAALDMDKKAKQAGQS